MAAIASSSSSPIVIPKPPRIHHQHHPQTPSPRSPKPTASTAAVPDACPACLGKVSAGGGPIVRWRYWREHDEWVWLCARHDPGERTAFCGYHWRAGRPRAACEICGIPLVIEQHDGRICYWCGFCKDYSQ